MAPFTVAVVQHGERAQVAVTGELDTATAVQLAGIDVADLAAAGCRAIALDLTGLTFLDSSGIGSLVGLRNRAAGFGVPTTVCAAPRHIEHTLTVAGLAGLFGLTR